ncbi:BQ5605_C002g01180 [Microbotryum silenes-dioicae]|uniref:BQ5605_C002g01180 protein n=1 Tax=Microbotryum silenes-dioicae TaxID=796604 RepID=A0A2X0M2J5_9BASI|nr:BQ5605_C002g01180 [Microbotryum silenes-dioicae]
MLPACNPGCWMAPGLGQLANEIDLLSGSTCAIAQELQWAGINGIASSSDLTGYFEGHPDYKPRGLRSDARIRTNIPGTRHMLAVSSASNGPSIQADFDEAANPSGMDWDDERHSEYGGGHERDFSPAPYFSDRTSRMPIAPDYIATAERLSLADLRQVESFEPATRGQSKKETYKQFVFNDARLRSLERPALLRQYIAATVLKEYRTRIQDFDDILARIFTVPVDIAAEYEESRLFREILSPLYQECQRPLPEDEIRTDEDQEGSDRLFKMDPKGVPPFSRETCPGRVLGSVRKRTSHLASSAQTICNDGACQEYNIHSERSGQLALVHVPEPPKPPTDADREPERKKIWDSWIVECAHRWLALLRKQRETYRWMRKREEDAISEHSSATGQHSDHGSAAGSEAKSNLSALSELTSLSKLERGLDTGT